MGRSGRPMPSPVATKNPERPPGADKNLASPPVPQVTFLYNLATFCGIFVAVLLAYWPALHGGLVWDDVGHVTPPGLRSWHGLWRIWFELGASQQYYPILHSFFWIEHRLWGDAVLGYHLTNLAQHALAAFLVVLIVRRLQLPGDWLAGLIFALHPVCVEAVAWISEQKDTLSAIFYLASALIYLRFDRGRKKSDYFWALVLFLLALMSKSVTATLPGALLVVLWWKRGRLEWKRDVFPILPWFGLGAASGLFTAWVERNYIGASGAGYELTLAQHLLLAGRIICFYVGKAVWPVNLVFSYPQWHPDPALWWQYLYPIAVIFAAAGFILIARRDDLPVRRGPLAGFLFFIGTLFPVLGFLHVYPFRYSYVADHFQYLALLGIVVPAAWLLHRALTSSTARNAVAVVLLAILATLTWQQASLYRDPETLYRATLARNPQSWMTHNNLGILLAQDPNRLAEAADEFQTTLRIQPDHMKAHMNLGNIWSQTPGRLPDAIAEYETALQLDPGYVPAYDNLGSGTDANARTPARRHCAISDRLAHAA